MSLGKELLISLLSRQNSCTCLQDFNDKYSKSALIEKVILRQQQLLASGFEVTNRVFIATQRGLQYWIDCLAVWGLGGVVMPLDISATKERILFLIEMVEPDFVLVNAPIEYVNDRQLLCPMNGVSEKSHLIYKSVEDKALAAILFTSGTTGQPKGVMLSNRALTGNANTMCKILDYGPQDKLFFAIGFQFVSAFSHFIVSMLKGAALFCTEKLLFKSDLMAELVRLKATCFGGAPLQMRWIAENRHVNQQEVKLRWMMSSGDHLSKNIITLLEERLPGRKIYTVYGLTELGGRFCVLKPGNLAGNEGTVGSAIEGLVVEIRGDDGALLPKNEIGDIYARGEYLFDGYLGGGANVLTPYGFLTGDIGYIDGNGCLHVCGRKDNVFKCMGNKISTLPITDAVLQMGCFIDVVVVAIEHDAVGSKVPIVFYVLKPGAEFKPGQLIKFLRKKLSSNYMPYEYVAMSKIPRTGSGKPIYQALKKYFYESIENNFTSISF